MNDSIMREDVPMGYSELISTVETIKARYDFAECYFLGKSVLGRRIPLIILGKGKNPVLFVGAHHALEYMTSMILVRFCGDLCESFVSGTPFDGARAVNFFKNRCVYIIPMLNPDGVELHLNGIETAGKQKDTLESITGGDFSNWQANAHGVDLNHNYNAGFEILRKMEIEEGFTGPGPTRFGGLCAESEPETHALCNLCRRILFSRVYAFHSQGEEIYWDYGENTPDNAPMIANLLSKVSGYAISKPSGLASYGGFKDWYIEVFKRPGFTVEVGKGKNPLPVSDFPDIYEKLKPLLLAALSC